MRAVVQRVCSGKVTVAGTMTSVVRYVILLGIAKEDVPTDADLLAEKIAGLCLFEDENGKMNLSIMEVGGEVLVVSQFTLYGDVRQGQHPGFDRAARPEQAEPLYERFVLPDRSFVPDSDWSRYSRRWELPTP
jgi:D-tyrosyl-tRNA(Tyr) deacylase